jgi:hypothetical protein
LSKISSSGQKVSGYFNISYPGSSIFEIVSNTIRYCNLYGMPDAIFIQVLDMARFYDIEDKDPDEIKNVTLSRLGKPDFIDTLLSHLQIYNYQYLMMLEAFCKTNKTELFVMSWNYGKYFSIQTDLENFYESNLEDLTNSISLHLDKNPKDLFALVARDGAHPGTAEQEYWADNAFNLYNKSVRRKNVN